MKQAFISYGRKDDERWVQALRDELEEALEGTDWSIWWHRESMEKRGETFLAVLRNAIEKSDKLIAVIGPQALKSPYVLYEWAYALKYCKVVIPVLRRGRYTAIEPALRSRVFTDLTDEHYGPVDLSDIARVHVIDCTRKRRHREGFTELLEALREPPSPLGDLLVEQPLLPAKTVERTREYQKLASLVLSDIREPRVKDRSKQITGVLGRGGLGKTVLALSFVRTAMIRREFHDGILWLTLGQDTTGLGRPNPRGARRASKHLDRAVKGWGGMESPVPVAGRGGPASAIAASGQAVPDRRRRCLGRWRPASLCGGRTRGRFAVAPVHHEN